jgi:DNA-binding PadR family transcriptional regulator
MHAHAMPNWFAMAGQRGRGRPHRRPHGGHGFGPPFGPGFGGFGPRGPRARRGDVRAALLVLLAEGSVYPALSQLEDEGLVQAQESGGRKEFDLTEAGRAYVSENADELGTPWEEVGGGEPIGELRTLVFSVGAAVMQVVQAGSADQVAQAAKVLEETRRSLYRILAGDDRDGDDTPPAAA